MNYNQLSIDQAPSISVPLSFIMAAPLFAIAAASILLLSGPEIFQNRWQASTLAITHLITLGFISMTMMGALFQLLPVLAGAQIPSPKITSRAIFSLYTLGVICLVAGFFLSHQLLSRAALLLLALGFLVFLLMVSYVLYKTDVSSGSVKGMRYAISSLWIAICLGLILLTGHAWDSFALLRHLTGLHIAWAAIGWMTILIISIAYQVIPMFQITASYPRFIERHFSTGIFLLLISWSLSQFFQASHPSNLMHWK